MNVGGLVTCKQTKMEKVVSRLTHGSSSLIPAENFFLRFLIHDIFLLYIMGWLSMRAVVHAAGRWIFFFGAMLQLIKCNEEEKIVVDS